MKAKTLDKKFDDGKSVLKHFDLFKTTRPGLEQKRVNVDFPVWMIQRLDKEAKRLGVPASRAKRAVNSALPLSYLELCPSLNFPLRN